MTDNDATGSLAVQRRRESRRGEWTEQTKLAEMLAKYLDPAFTFWTALENKPLSRLSGLFQKRRGVRSGLPDVLVISRGKPIFVELKSRAGVATKVQKQVRVELLPVGAAWWMDGTKRTRCHDGAAPLRRGLPPSMEAASAATVREAPFADPLTRPLTVGKDSQHGDESFMRRPRSCHRARGEPCTAGHKSRA
jgi:hypothetical protein